MDNFDSAWGGPRRLFASFAGNGSEYFRIWIVNTLLTIVTLGIYLPYAKVRKRRWFYWNTYLEGHRFDYLAEPKALIIGYAIVGIPFLISNVTSSVYPTLGAALTAIFYLVVPWFVYKAHRFKARYSAYRGIKFRFLGTVGEAYKVFGLLPGIFLIPVIAFFIWAFSVQGEFDPKTATSWLLPAFLLLLPLYPWWMFMRMRYAYSNIAWGKATAYADLSLKYFYGTYVRALGLGIIAGLAGGTLAALLGAVVFASGKGGILGVVFGFLFAIPYLAAYALIDQYIYARITNHCWNSTRIGPISFSVELNPWQLAWIRITNGLGILFTLGFYAPWAAVRKHAAIVNSFTAITSEELEVLAARSDEEVSAVGDAATDLFDLDIGW